MTVTIQAAAFENARRFIAQVSAFADQIGARDRVSFTIVATRTSIAAGAKAIPRVGNTDGWSVGGAVNYITRCMEAAEQAGERVDYEITPVFPAFHADEVGVGVTHRGV